MTDQEFYEIFMSDVGADATVKSAFTERIFVERMCTFLEQEAILPNYDIIMHRNEPNNEKISAWHLDETEGKLYLVVSNFDSAQVIQTLNQESIDRLLKQAKRFFTNLKKREHLNTFDDTTTAYIAATNIVDYYLSIRHVNIILVTNSRLGSRVKLKPERTDNLTFDYDVWDISRIQLIESSGQTKEPIEIVLSEFDLPGLPYLTAFKGDTVLQSYLSIVPGTLLAGLYEKYGERLLEQNVRTFLQFKGVNKGIRNTIKNTPDMFFCYNNGITATAEGMSFSEDEKYIVSLNGLQIVNGGQTTASIFTTKCLDRDNTVDLSKVFVQMKLTIVPQDKVDEIVPNISQYANTQNKVNTADFTSNHPFHRQLEQFSRTFVFPFNNQSVYWFYERSRGQYANSFSQLTCSKLKQFLLLHPKSHMFTKTDMAKAAFTFALKPFIVSKGGNTCYQEFAKEIVAEWESNEIAARTKYSEMYFRRMTAMMLIYNAVDKTIANAPWYTGDYKAQMRTYSIAYMLAKIQKRNQFLNLNMIAKKQVVPKEILEYLLGVSKMINEWFVSFAPQNIGQLCKQKAFWENMLDAIDFKIPQSFSQFMISRDEELQVKVEADRTGKIIAGINLQNEVVANRKQGYWLKVYEFMQTHRLLTDEQDGILRVAALIPKKLPSELQCKVILSLEKIAIREGFFEK